MYNICFVKNISGETKIFHGQLLNNNDQYLIPDNDRAGWIVDDTVTESIAKNELQIGDGTNWFTVYMTQINWLQNLNQTTKTLDNKIWTQNSARPFNTTTYFTSRGDDIANKTNVGGGSSLQMTHNIGDPTTQSVYVDLNIEENRTYIHEGYIMWQGTVFDSVSMTIVPRISTYTVGTNTNFNLYGGYMIVPAAGNGTIVPTEIQLVEMTISRDTGIRKPGFWNATYNSTTHQFENITPAPLMDGRFNIFTVEATLAKFANRLLLLNDGFIKLDSNDTDELGIGMRIKLTAYTEDGDHNWKSGVLITMYRAKTA